MGGIYKLKHITMKDSQMKDKTKQIEQTINQPPIEWLKDVLYPYLKQEDREFTNILFDKAKELEKTSMCSFTTGYVNNCVEIDHNEIELTKEVEEYYDWLQNTRLNTEN